MKFDNNNFELFLFTTDTSIAGKCLAAGVNAIIIDWENKGKDKRQNGYGTQINYDTAEDLVNMRNSISGKIICRINKYDPEYSAEEIDKEIDIYDFCEPLRFELETLPSDVIILAEPG